MEIRLESKNRQEPNWVVSDERTDYFIALLKFTQIGMPDGAGVYSRFDLGKRMFIDAVPVDLPDGINEQIANEIQASTPDRTVPSSQSESKSEYFVKTF